MTAPSAESGCVIPVHHFNETRGQLNTHDRTKVLAISRKKVIILSVTFSETVRTLCRKYVIVSAFL